MEAEICSLDPGTPPRWQGDRQGSVECADSESSTGRMGENAQAGLGGPTRGIVEPQSPVFYFSDITSNVDNNPQPCPLEALCVYFRYSESILGEEDDLLPPELNTNRCFNCGSPDHVVSSCPSPPNRELISLSRQLYNFLQGSRGLGDSQRIHIVEEWRQQRLEWVEIFEPGEVRGLLLRDALGVGDGDWLKNMAIWGYPKGWASEMDPRDEVKRRIWSEGGGGEEEEDEPFLVFGDGGDVEEIRFPSTSAFNMNPESDVDSCDEDQDAYSDANSHSSSTTASKPSVGSNDDPPHQPTTPHIRRWATYPSTYFSSTLLPIYTGHALPSISHRGSSTYTDDRRSLWERIVSSGAHHHSAANNDGHNSIPPWRVPGVFGADPSAPRLPFGSWRNNMPLPLPPQTDPPPLPPLPPPEPPLLLPPLPLIDLPPSAPPLAVIQPTPSVGTSIDNQNDEVDQDMDMDMSDSD